MDHLLNFINILSKFDKLNVKEIKHYMDLYNSSSHTDLTLDQVVTELYRERDEIT